MLLSESFQGFAQINLNHKVEIGESNDLWVIA